MTDEQMDELAVSLRPFAEALIHEERKEHAEKIAELERQLAEARKDSCSRLITLAAWLLSPAALRPMDLISEQSHIGHRQFDRAFESQREIFRCKAIEIRTQADAAIAAKEKA
jgi:hypothetical protein